MRSALALLNATCAGVFAVDGAFNAAVTPDISGALAPVVQPFLGQLVTGAFAPQELP